MKVTDDYGDGDVYQWTTKYFFDKKGLLKKSKLSNGKVVFKRNKKGAVTSSKTYEGKKLTYIAKVKYNKKGLAASEKTYYIKNGKKTLFDTATFTYYSNGNKKKEVYEGRGNLYNEHSHYKETEYYRKNGTLKKAVRVRDDAKYTVTYDKYEDPTKQVYTLWGDDFKTTGTTTYRYKRNKKKEIVKCVETDETDGTYGPDKTITTVTYKYKHDKHGNIVKEVMKSVRDHNGEKTTSKLTTETKYKKIKIEKKYLPYVENWLLP